MSTNGLKTRWDKLRPGKRKLEPSPKRAKPFYQEPEWVALMARIRRERGNACQDPEHPAGVPRHGRRLFGDHIVELKDGGAELDPRNILLRCAICHSRKTARERAARYAARPVP